MPFNFWDIAVIEALTTVSLRRLAPGYNKKITFIKKNLRNSKIVLNFALAKAKQIAGARKKMVP